MEKLNKLKQAIGVEEPMLIDVLKWHSFGDNRSIFGVVEGDLYFYKYDNEDNCYEHWNDSHYLKDQSEELINWLASLI